MPRIGGGTIGGGGTTGGVTTAANTVNVLDYGAKGDGVTDDLAAINAAITASKQGGTVVFPATGAAAGGATTYAVSGDVQLASNRAYVGGFAPGGVTVKYLNGVNGTAVLLSKAYATNATTSGNPVRIEHLSVDGNKANNTAGHGILLMNYNSTIRGCNISNTAGAGIVLSDQNAAAATITNTSVETRIVDNKVNAPGTYGIWVKDTNGSGKFTDGYCQNNIIAGAADTCIYIQRSAGWFITDNHVYAGLKSGFVLQNFWCTYVINNEVDGFGADTVNVGTYMGINVDSILVGRPGIIQGNTVSANEAPRPANSYLYYRIRSGSAVTTRLVFDGNSVHRDTTGGVASTDVSWQPNSGTLNVMMGTFNTDSAAENYTRGTPGTINLYGPGSLAGKGDLAVGVSPSRQSRVPVGADGTVLTADAASAAGVRWAAAAAGGGTTFTAASVAPGGANDIYMDYGNRAAGVIETMSRDVIDPTSGSPSPSAGTMALTYFTPDQAVTVTNLSSATRGTAAVAPTLTRMGVYSVDATTGDLTLLGATTADTTTWTATQTLYTRALAAGVTLTRGQRYAFALLHVGSTTAPTLAGKGGVAGLLSATPRRGGYVTGQTDLPATVTAATVNANTASGNYYYGRMV